MQKSVGIIGSCLLASALHLGSASPGFSQSESSSASVSEEKVSEAIEQLNDPEFQDRVRSYIKEEFDKQLSSAGIEPSPELFAEITARYHLQDKSEKSGGEILESGAVFITTACLFLLCSDENLKERIELVGISPSGINIYEFSYTGFQSRWRGVIAQEILISDPVAVAVSPNGLLAVDYDLIDVQFERVK